MEREREREVFYTFIFTSTWVDKRVGWFLFRRNGENSDRISIGWFLFARNEENSDRTSSG